jgi:hypothetical protein
MKTKLIIEIETPDYHEIFPEEGQTDEDFEGKEEELEEARREYSKELHDCLVEEIKRYFEERLEDEFADQSLIEEYYVEGWDELKDYGIKLKITEEKSKK